MTTKTKNNNNTILKNIADAFGIQTTSTEAIPSTIATDIQPIVNVGNIFSTVVKSSTCTNSLATNMYTTPATQDFYLTGASLSVIKDTTATSLFSFIQVTLADNTTCNILQLPGITLTAQSASISISLPFPVKLARGLSVYVQNGTNVGNVTSSATITGYVNSLST
jgi:hypothetical protein